MRHLDVLYSTLRSHRQCHRRRRRHRHLWYRPYNPRMHTTYTHVALTHIYDIGREGRIAENSFAKFSVKLILCGWTNTKTFLPKLHTQNGRDAHSQILPKN